MSKERVNISGRRPKKKKRATLVYSKRVRPSLSGQRNILFVRKESHPKISKYQLEFRRLFFGSSLSFFFFLLWESAKKAWRAEAQRVREGWRGRGGERGVGVGGKGNLASEWPTLPHRRALQTDRHPHSTMWHGATEPSPAARGV